MWKIQYTLYIKIAEILLKFNILRVSMFVEKAKILRSESYHEKLKYNFYIQNE